MPKLVWDQTGEKLYEAGVDHCVFYPQASDGTYTGGVAWNGITSVSETPDGGDDNDFYADNIKYGSLRGTENIGGSIEAYMSPPEFDAVDGSLAVATGVYIKQQARKTFGLSYRTQIGNDVDGLDHGFKLHLIYGASVSPSDKSYETINDSPDAQSLSWDYTTTPVPVTGVTGARPTSLLIIDSTKVDETKLGTLMDELYGTDGQSGKTARLPLPNEVINMLK